MDLTKNMMALLDKNKEDLKDDFYLKMANLLKVKHEKKKLIIKNMRLFSFIHNLKKAGQTQEQN